MGLYFTLATSPRAASCGTEPASCQGTHSKLYTNLAAPQNSGSKESKQDTSCPRVTSSECPQTSEADWGFTGTLPCPLLCFALFPFPTPSPGNPCRAQAGQKPVQLLWVRIWVSLWLLHARVIGKDRVRVGQMKDWWLHFTN